MLQKRALRLATGIPEEGAFRIFVTSDVHASQTIQMLKRRSAIALRKNAVKVLDYGRASQFGQARQASELAEKATNLWPEMPGF